MSEPSPAGYEDPGPSMLGPYGLGQAGPVPKGSRFDADADLARVGHTATERPRQPTPTPR